MAIAKEDRDFLRGINRRVADQALEPNDPLYEPIYEQLDADDPVAIMQARIELSDVQTMQLFSGFSGAGKTTELFRLRRNLRWRQARSATHWSATSRSTCDINRSGTV
jgi:signal recognition particle GTPase